MAAFYKRYRVGREADDLICKEKYILIPNIANICIDLFNPHSYDHLSQLYHAIQCEHYLIPESPDKRPTIPGLTPIGFAQWMTTWILAYPNKEASRLKMIVKYMPIDADEVIVYGKPKSSERLPKVRTDYSCCNIIAHIVRKSHAISSQESQITKSKKSLTRPYGSS
jgi:hypothetical protein